MAFDEAEDFAASFSELDDPDALIMDFDKINLVHCSGKEDVQTLFAYCDGWAYGAFQKVEEWFNTSWYVVEGNRICRWFPTKVTAMRAFGWAPIVSPDVFAPEEAYNSLSLEEVLKACR